MNEKNFVMLDWVGRPCDDTGYALCIVIKNDEGVDEVRELLKKNEEEYQSIYCPGIYWWDEENDLGYRRLANCEIDMFKQAFAIL